ncbi:breast cancer type 2 susceptibility protein isoform X2 [Monomorium pharaonis]|nr:breast cancer type 2 susceptibility protein isoform X2 [Monomorium pharaonis]
MEEETPKFKQRTPELSIVKSADKIISPVIAPRVTRRRSKRRIFRTSISIDPLAVTNNEDITVNVQGASVTSDIANSIVRDDVINVAVCNPSLESASKDCEPKVLNKSQDGSNTEESENIINAVPDSSNTSTQEFFDNASFSIIDELCSDTFNNKKVMETTTPRCNYEQNIEGINKGRNVEENKNIGFLTARGASINVSKQALLKAKRLFADAFDMDETQTQNYEPFAKRKFNELKNMDLPSFSFDNNVSVNIAKETLSKPKPFAEQLKKWDTSYADCKKPLVNKSLGEEVNKSPILFSTAGGNPINISKEALLRAKALLADEADNVDDDVLMKYCGESTNKNSTIVKNMPVPSCSGDRSISEKSPAKVRTSFAEESNIIVKFASSKTDNKQCDLSSSNIEFRTVYDTHVNSKEQIYSEARTLFAEQLYDSLQPIATKEIHNSDIEIKKQEAKVSQIGFQTASGNRINISREALLRAKALLADETDNIDDDVLMKYCEESPTNKNSTTVKNMAVPSCSDGRSTSGKSPAKARSSFTEESNITVKFNSSKIDNKQYDINSSNIEFRTVHDTPVNPKEQIYFGARTLFAEKLDDSLQPIATKEIHNSDIEIKRQEAKVSQIGFQTASGNRINISREALLRAKALLADETDNVDDDVLMKYCGESPTNKNSTTVKNMAVPSCSDGRSISGKSPAKARLSFTEESNITVKFTSSKIDNKQYDINSSNIEFRAVHDTPVNSKARTLFAEKLHDSLQPIVTKEIHNSDIEIKRQEAKVSQIGFQTASGNRINISREALLRAKALLADETDDVDDDALMKYCGELSTNRNSTTVKNMAVPSCSDGRSISGKSPAKARSSFAEESNITVKFTSSKIDNKQYDINSSNIEFRTVYDTPVNPKEQIHSEARTLFAKQLHDSLQPIVTKEIHNSDIEIKKQGAKVSQIGFQTASGKSINISEQALSRAKAMFAEHLDDTLEEVAVEETNPRIEKLRESQVKVSDVRFQPTGSIVGISEQTSKVSFGQFDDKPESAVAIETNKIDAKVENKQEEKISSIGFQTARGTSITVSEQALSRARALFADQLDCSLEINALENVGRDDEKTKNRRDLTILHGGLQVASGQRVPVSNNAALIARELSFDDYLDESNPDSGRASLQKRQLSETNVDESTPLGRNCTSETKKVRLCGEFQVRKLFSNNPTSVDDNDENRNPELEKRRASSVVDSDLGSPERDVVKPTESDRAGSPIIGRQSSFLKKRKSSDKQRHQRNEYSTPRSDKRILENAALQENVVHGSASRGKIEDDKSDREMREPTQIARERARGNSTESNETQYGDTQVMIDFINESTKILRDRLAAALEQEAIITAKRGRGSEKQSMGHLYRYKQINSNARLSLRKIGGGAAPQPRSRQELVDRRIPPEILEITAATAATYRFHGSDFYGNDVAHSNVRGIEMEDGMRLIMDENGDAGVWELLRAFLAGPAVEPNLVPARWIENHYRWIVWKLASMDRMRFGSAELPRALTPSNVMAQLKYRYDREIDRFQRPIIRRILEKDDVASKRMILCVSAIVENNNVSKETMETGKSPIRVPKWRIELTDGWYSVNACIDIGMIRNISTGKIREGTKLVMSGAELLNCDQGFHPLEVPADVCLKLHTNSTRRARWDTKLGYAPCSGPIPIELRNVCPSGGLIGKMTIVVARVYPMLYHEKTVSGDSIVRNAKSEEKAQSKYEQQCWAKIETFYAKAEDFQGKGLSCETDDMAIQLSEDYENLYTESVSKKRHDELLQELRQREEQFKQRMQSKLRESLPGPRQVSQLLKVRVCDGNANAILSVWSPSEVVVDTLKEGACVSLRNIVASGKRGTELQLTARRSAIFKPGRMRDTSYPARVCTSLCEIANSEFSPPYGEFDTVGLVCSIGSAPYGMKDFDAVHLAYCKADSSDPSYLTILFWQGIGTYGYAEILTVGSIVACNNLEWRRVTSWNVPAAYCTDRSTFTRNPRRNHLYESFENLRNLITDPLKYAESCSIKLNVELQKKSTPTRYKTGTPTKMYSSTTSSVDKKLVNYSSPLATLKLGTDNSSSYVASNPSIRKRLEKLQQYGVASGLSPIILKNSKRTSLDFRSPVRILDISSTKENANQSGD